MRYPAAALLSALLLAAGCASRHDVRADMVALDRVYIPALAMTNEDKGPSSMAVMDSLSSAWARFLERHGRAKPDDALWKPELDSVGRLIERAHKVVDSDWYLSGAHEQLEQVRHVMSGLRQRNGIDFFTDRLTAFHDPMEVITLGAAELTPDSALPGHVVLFRAALDRAREEWRRVAEDGFDARLHGFDAARVAEMDSLIRAEQAALEALAAALDTGDPEQYLPAARAIKPPFASLYMMFGDMTLAFGPECPACGERKSVPIVWGNPTQALASAMERGEIVLGGCEVPDNPPDRHCLLCGLEWREERRR